MDENTSIEMLGEVMDYINENGVDEESIQAIEEISILETLEEIIMHVNYMSSTLIECLEKGNYVTFVSHVVLIFDYIEEMTEENCDEHECNMIIKKIHKDAYKVVGNIIKDHVNKYKC